MSNGGPIENRSSASHGAGAVPRRIPLESILQGASEIVIVHNGHDYRLRITAKGKLILTK